MLTEIAKVTLWKPKWLIKVRATQMSGSQHKTTLSYSKYSKSFGNVM